VPASSSFQENKRERKVKSEKIKEKKIKIISVQISITPYSS